MPTQTKNPAAAALGKLGGSVKSKAKAKAARMNATKPRPNRRRMFACARRVKQLRELAQWFGTKEAPAILAPQGNPVTLLRSIARELEFEMGRTE